jgi:probable rRNA maturation factor
MTARVAGDAGRPRIDVALLRRRAARVLGALGHARSELSVLLADDAEIAELNGRWRGLRRPTDVLSFSLVEGAGSAHRGRLLGDVVIGVGEAARQARRAHRALDDVAARLLIHGVLHLLGHDHERDEDARRMRAEERRVWRAARARSG